MTDTLSPNDTAVVPENLKIVLSGIRATGNLHPIEISDVFIVNHSKIQSDGLAGKLGWHVYFTLQPKNTIEGAMRILNVGRQIDSLCVGGIYRSIKF